MLVDHIIAFNPVFIALGHEGISLDSDEGSSCNGKSSCYTEEQ